MFRNRFLMMLTLLLVVLTATANDSIMLRPCRSGTYLLQQSSKAGLRKARAESVGNKYIGKHKQLVILASFKDRLFAESETESLQKWDKIFNAEHYTEEAFVGSVRDYFYAQSYQQFDLTFDLVYVQLPDSAQKYSSTYAHDENSQYLVDDIVDDLMTRNIDWSIYDWDGDSYVDQLLIVYAGKGMNAGGGANTIWPHQWWLSKHLVEFYGSIEPKYRSYRTVSSNGKDYMIDCYCCVQEDGNYGSVKTSFGTICHEYSHCFGLPDFYYDAFTVVNRWDLMDYGNYGDDGYRPCNYSAHERMYMGWLNPVELTSKTTVTDMPPLHEQPVAYIIRNDAHPDEYYMIENRQKEEWDASLPGSGILIFHVDYDKEIWNSTITTPNSSSKKRYHIFAANNGSVSSLAKWTYPYINNQQVINDELTDTSKPAAILNNENIDGNKLMSKPITKLMVNEDKKASFVFMDDMSGIEHVEKDGEDAIVVYDLNGRRLPSASVLSKGIYIIRYADGTVRKLKMR